MKISQKLEQAAQHQKVQTLEDEVVPTFSFEFFVPKTPQGVQNLYNRMDRMHQLGPQFVDITWNAGGVLSNLSCEITHTAQSVIGIDTCMHLTCTGMPIEMIDNALKSAYDSGCQNILALRGDPVVRKEGEEPAAFNYAIDLVRYIREKYGDHFAIGVAAYPEGHPEEPDVDVLIKHLKEKVDAGADFIITQMFYDSDNFISWVKKCRAVGIEVPILPGIMPITSYASFIRRATWCEINIPPNWLEALEPIKDDDVKVRALGSKLVAEMCSKILNAGIGITHLHFYTMNLSKSSVLVLEELDALSKQPSNK